MNKKNFLHKITIPLCIFASLHLLLLNIFLLSSNVFATELQGGVTFTVDSAREYIQEGLPDGIEIPDSYYQLQSGNVEKMVTSYDNSGEVVGVTVQYINEPTRAYIYKKRKLAYVEKYDKPVNIYPHRGYRYDLDGKLVLTSLTVSKSELFRFTPQGKLIAHSINGTIYDEDGNVIGSGK